MSGDGPGEPQWTAGRHLVVTRSGTLLVEDDPRATASPAITPDGRHPLPAPLIRPDLDRLQAATGRADHPWWQGRWQPVDLPDPPRRAPRPDEPLVARLPAVLAPAVGGFAVSSPDGPVRVGPEHLDLLGSFLSPTTPSSLPEGGVDVTAVVEELVGAGLLVDPERVDGTFDAGARARRQRRQRQLRARRSLAALDELAGGADGRTPVIGLLTSLSDFPLSLGMVLAHAAAQPELADRYSFHLVYATPGELAAVGPTGVWLFAELPVDRGPQHPAGRAPRADNRDPQLTVFGGPQVPGPGGVAAWMAAAGVDVAVHGEGERALGELLARLPDRWPEPRRRSPAAVGPESPGARSPGPRARSPARAGTASPTSTSLPSPFLHGLVRRARRRRVLLRRAGDQPGLPLRLHLL